ncbi:MAG TPA: DUF1326 domain-containing protein [Usitatibacter sp.]|nr:DUF1326 domain-containing protein [Usitatibacter sp.]
MIDWFVKGVELGNCNCRYACPCQFGELPSHGSCRAMGGFQVEQGRFGDVKLDGLLAVGTWSWPGAVHEGNGTMQLVIDERADARQRDALEKIMSGQETKEAATMWWVYGTMSPNKLPALYRRIEFSADIEKRRGRVFVEGVIETHAEPIRTARNGAEHRVRIDLPHGFEYEIAEIASATTKATAGVPLDLKSSYGQLARIHLSGNGVVRNAPARATA